MGKGLSMGLSDVELRVTVLAAFSLALPLHSVRSFLWAFSEVPSRGSSSATALLGLGRGPQDKLGLGQGPQFLRPHNSPSKAYCPTFSWGGGF